LTPMGPQWLDPIRPEKKTYGIHIT
jgi:hypothetical protein